MQKRNAVICNRGKEGEKHGNKNNSISLMGDGSYIIFALYAKRKFCAAKRGEISGCRSFARFGQRQGNKSRITEHEGGRQGKNVCHSRRQINNNKKQHKHQQQQSQSVPLLSFRAALEVCFCDTLYCRTSGYCYYFVTNCQEIRYVCFYYKRLHM